MDPPIRHNAPVDDLATRLGIKHGARVGFVNEPDWFAAEVEPLPGGVELLERASEPLDVIVYFSDTKDNMARRVPLLRQYLAPGATLWLGHPSPESQTKSDLARVDVLAIGAAADLTQVEELSVAGWDLLGFHQTP